MVKQFGAARPQAVQKPFALSLQVPAFLLPVCSRGSRVIFPSGVKVILNLVPDRLTAVKGWPVKKVERISAGGIGSAAKAVAFPKSTFARMSRASPNMRTVPRLQPATSNGAVQNAKRASNLALGLAVFQPPKQNDADNSD